MQYKQEKYDVGNMAKGTNQKCRKNEAFHLFKGVQTGFLDKDKRIRQW